ncbi:MAG: S-layer homology domain-containing protein [Oscillospiraceae bacterium]|nr:S-layer homology domain-containing protein [Oscillospiraceae bacterium]
MKTFRKILVSLCLIFCCCIASVSAASAGFADVDPRDWYAQAVEYVAQNGIMKGVSASSFAPDGTVNRAMMATVLWRLAGEPDCSVVDGESQGWLYTDLPGNEYYTTAALWAKVENIMLGYAIPYDTNDAPTGYCQYSFRPLEALSREQLATVLYRCAKWKGLQTDISGDLATFSDEDAVSSWAKEAMDWCVSTGLIHGTLQNGSLLLDPKGTTTRAQLATILMRLDLLSAT